MTWNGECGASPADSKPRRSRDRSGGGAIRTLDCPVVGFRSRMKPEHLFEGKAFERGTALGMGQTKLSSSVAARNDRGKPPRRHKSVARATPSSLRSNPLISMNSTRPASDSDVCLRRSGEALPRTRNRAGFGSRSTSTRSTGNRSGRRWISSSTTSPRAWPRMVIGCSRLITVDGSSRSRSVWSGHDPANARARVVLPHCRGPRSATTGLRRTALSSRCRSATRSIITRSIISVKIQTPTMKFQKGYRRVPGVSDRGKGD
jgi:hypothetical protein